MKINPTPDLDNGSEIALEHFQYAILTNPHIFLNKPQRPTVISGPYQAFFVKLTDVLNGSLLRTAELTSWLYLVTNGDLLAEVELHACTSEKHLAFKGLHLKRFAEFILKTESLVKTSDCGRRRGYDIRLLQIPGAHFYAIWLHGGEDDFLTPFTPAPSGLNPERLYTEAEILELLKPQAELSAQF